MNKKNSINIDYTNTENFITNNNIKSVQPEIQTAVDSLFSGTCPGNNFLGWIDLPSKTAKQELLDIKNVANEINNNANHLILIGIGGSYLGARSAIEFMLPPFRSVVDKVLYYGHHLSSEYTNELLNYIVNKDVYVNIISKSGGTTEPAVAFRLLLKALSQKYGQTELAKRIITTTDPSSGTLRAITNDKGYRNFPIPSDVGGRFSIFCPAGLLPMAVAGLDIDALLEGAKSMANLCKTNNDVLTNPVLLYSAIRYLLYSKGKKIEIISSFLPNLFYFGEWWKQLFGESEGKDGKGIFPAAVNFTTDLHSMGQYIQEGERQLFETFLSMPERKSEQNIHTVIETLENNPDGLNYLVGKDLNEINHKAYLGTSKAHTDGNVPNLTITIPEKSEYYLGQLYYFFEFAVAVSGLLIGINPFNQPGVEAYKTNMFNLLGKPGY
jgi:glucose-6-phosphate isomerase